MSFNNSFIKSYDNELHCYVYCINGIRCYSSEDLSEDEACSALLYINNLS